MLTERRRRLIGALVRSAQPRERAFLAHAAASAEVVVKVCLMTGESAEIPATNLRELKAGVFRELGIPELQQALFMAGEEEELTDGQIQHGVVVYAMTSAMTLRCVRCGLKRSKCGSGRDHCDGAHSGTFKFGKGVGSPHWTCCSGKKYGSRGCTKQAPHAFLVDPRYQHFHQSAEGLIAYLQATNEPS